MIERIKFNLAILLSNTQDKISNGILMCEMLEEILGEEVDLDPLSEEADLIKTCCALLENEHENLFLIKLKRYLIKKEEYSLILELGLQTV